MLCQFDVSCPIFYVFWANKSCDYFAQLKFWKGHKLVRNLPLTFDCMYCQGEDFAKFCGLLRILYELNWEKCSKIYLFFCFSDGLTDCEDPECCEDPVCRKSQLCHTVPYPIDILLRKQPPSSTASFFERMKFIIEDKGLQSYVERAGFNER